MNSHPDFNMKPPLDDSAEFSFSVTLAWSLGWNLLLHLSIGVSTLQFLSHQQQSTKLHDLVEEHNKVQVTVCTKSEGESSASYFPHKPV